MLLFLACRITSRKFIGSCPELDAVVSGWEKTGAVLPAGGSALENKDGSYTAVRSVALTSLEI